MTDGHGEPLRTAGLRTTRMEAFLRERLIRSDVADADVKLLTRRLAPGLAGYVAVIVVGLFLPVLAVFAYLAIALYILLPVGALRRRVAAPGL